MKASTRVGSFRDGDKYRIEIYELNMDTGEYEIVWAVVRAKPFAARILHSKGSTTALVRVAKKKRGAQ